MQKAPEDGAHAPLILVDSRERCSLFYAESVSETGHVPSRSSAVEAKTMSRIGKLPIPIPAGVTVQIKDGLVSVKGPRGELSQELRPEVSAEMDGNELLVKRADDSRQARAFHGLFRSLVANMVTGVTSGFTKKLELHGVGYRAGMEKVQGDDCIVFKKGELGLSHPIYFALPEGINAKIEDRTKIVLEGNDKALVGLVAAKIRALKPPDAYKGKGIRYSDETVRLKEGKRGG